MAQIRAQTVKRESSIQTGILNYLETLRPKGKFYNMQGNAWQGAGRPDIIGCYKGRFIAIEVKRPGEEPTKLQRHELNLWDMTEAITMVATSVADVKKMIEELNSS